MQKKGVPITANKKLARKTLVAAHEPKCNKMWIGKMQGCCRQAVPTPESLAHRQVFDQLKSFFEGAVTFLHYFMITSFSCFGGRDRTVWHLLGKEAAARFLPEPCCPYARRSTITKSHQEHLATKLFNNLQAAGRNSIRLLCNTFTLPDPLV